MGQSQLLLLLLQIILCFSVPLRSKARLKRNSESSDNKTVALNEGCLLEDVVYPVGSEVPSLGPCERCICEGPNIVCSMIKCKPNSGCRIIQQSGHCCPQYKCDCEYNDKTYNNGERLENPEDPCQVCYCKGGEIMCTSITCYEREDCKPRYLQGQCCPKYDHCPLESNRVSGNSVRSVNSSLYSPKREMQPWLLTKPSNQVTSVGYEEASASHNMVYPQTIRIMEILPTTPGSVNKQGEVSVVPRIKVNGAEEGRETPVPGEATTHQEVYTAALSLSQVEVQSGTTPDTSDKSETLSSTQNPLAEYIITKASGDEKPSPDSERFATIFPNYLVSEKTTEEISTVESFTEVEGSGYELLNGGVYDELTTIVPTIEELQSSNSNVENPTAEATQASFINENYSQDNTTFPTINSSDIGTDIPDTTEKIRERIIQLSAEMNKSTKLNDTSSNSDESTLLNATSTLAQTTADQSQLTDHEVSTPCNDRNDVTTREEIISDPSSKDTHNAERLEHVTTPNEESTTHSNVGESNYEKSKDQLEIKYRNIDETAETREIVLETSTLPSLTFPPILNLHNLNPGNQSVVSNDTERNISSVAQVGIYHPTKPNDTPGILTVLDDNVVNNTDIREQMASHMLLTPNDLKKVAEMLIHEKIKPAFPDKFKLRSNDDFDLDGSTTTIPDENSENRTLKANLKSNSTVSELDGVEVATEEVGDRHSGQVSEQEEGASSAISHAVTGADLQLSSTELHNSTDQLSTTESSQEKGSSLSYLKMKNELTTTQSSGTTQDDNSVTETTTHNDDTSTISSVDIIKNVVSTTSYSQNDDEEDPYTSRQIRIHSSNDGSQYSSFLDDRDLLILENFLRKNIGLE